MLHHDSNVLEQADIEGRTALMWAAGKGANDVIKLLLDLNNAEPQPSSGAYYQVDFFDFIFTLNNKMSMLSSGLK